MAIIPTIKNSVRSDSNLNFYVYLVFPLRVFRMAVGVVVYFCDGNVRLLYAIVAIMHRCEITDDGKMYVLNHNAQRAAAH